MENVQLISGIGDKQKKLVKYFKLIFSDIEIARLDNDPNFPEHGVFNLTVQGGR